MRRGQMTIIGVMMVLVTIIFLAVVSPILYNFVSMISGNATANGDSSTAAISSSLPTFLALGVLVGIVIYSVAGRGRGREE